MEMVSTNIQLYQRKIQNEQPPQFQASLIYQMVKYNNATSS